MTAIANGKEVIELAFEGELYSKKIIDKLATIPDNTKLYGTPYLNNGVYAENNDTATGNQTYTVKGYSKIRRSTGSAIESYYLESTSSSASGWVDPSVITFK